MLRQVCEHTLHHQVGWHQDAFGGNSWHFDGANFTTFKIFSVLMLVCVCAFVCLPCKHVGAFQPGQTWSQSGNNCELFTCLKHNNTLATMSSHIVCPPFDENNCEPVSVIFCMFLCWNDPDFKCEGGKKKVVSSCLCFQNTIQTKANGCCLTCKYDD